MDPSWGRAVWRLLNLDPRLGQQTTGRDPVKGTEKNHAETPRKTDKTAGDQRGFTPPKTTHH